MRDELTIESDLFEHREVNLISSIRVVSAKILLLGCVTSWPLSQRMSSSLVNLYRKTTVGDSGLPIKRGASGQPCHM